MDLHRRILSDHHSPPPSSPSSPPPPSPPPPPDPTKPTLCDNLFFGCNYCLSLNSSPSRYSVSDHTECEDCTLYDAQCGGPHPPPPPPAAHSNQLFLFSIVSAFGFLALLVIVCYVVCLRHRRTRRSTAGGPPSDANEEEGPVHHVWYIRTVGLDESVIGSISSCVYKRGEGLIDGSDCSVCLNEFRDGELVRLLPKCSHAFHRSCVDTWLRSHVNCPLCRAPIVSADPPPPPQDLDRSEEVVPDGGGGGGSEAEEVKDSGSSSASAEMGHVGLRVLSDLGHRSTDTAEEMQPVRRSVSMDFSHAELMSLMIAKRSKSGVVPKGAIFDEERIVEPKEGALSRNGGRSRSFSILPM
ncbi:E3 ubiquitin-protein ligase RING1 [Acorus calamus]|uniref:RING-type E3 ubiquitin transferase n=1 Tax=Acorus calamus TaxID=4465 RepID=A0AAV9EKP6_ACOCL|nr:E3 ubiquitin-protein ligase RING1 [Acorus calamus]